MLSVSVVLSATVESAIECHMRVNDVLYAARCGLSSLCYSKRNASEIFLMLCGADHSRGENTCKHLGFETNEAVVHGFGVMSQ